MATSLVEHSQKWLRTTRVWTSIFRRGPARTNRTRSVAIFGVVLLLLTLFLSYTGYLLPWDQLAFWAITVGTNIISAMPFLGRETRFLLLGGNLVGQNALLRFYVLHCVILPLLTVVFVAVHFWRIQKDGGLTPAERSMRENDGR